MLRDHRAHATGATQRRGHEENWEFETHRYLEPFAAETDIDIRLEDYNGGLAQVRAQVETGNVHWDVVDLETADAVSGCDEGILERIDSAALPPGPDGTPAMEDFLPGSLFECAVGILLYSTVYAYNPERIAGEPPATMADFFDLERFPGRRGMRRVPHANLEFALIADGVPLDEVYATLDTPAGVDRAFRKLDLIKDHVVWWEAGARRCCTNRHWPARCPPTGSSLADAI